MCGICGFTGLNNKHLLVSMTKILVHRGPDDYGFLESDGINFGHRRLSIIDLTSAGKQPMTNNEGIWITYNGEIYNFKELRDLLRRKGYKFTSDTDSEVLIHGYSEWGFDLFSKLDGMFVFALWDESKKELILARDEVGIKPLYYSIIDGELVFSSEMKSILLHPSFKRKVDKRSLANFLNLRYVPEPGTIFQGVNKLSPGHFLLFKGGKVSITKFASAQIGNGLATRSIKKTLEQSVKKRLMSDVPLGVFLSGGLDSSSIVAMMHELKVPDIKTFSIGYEVKEEEDETTKAAKIADYFSTDHSEIIIDSHPLEILPKVLWHMDEPLADPTAIPMYFLSRYARKKVKVVLSGEGADEVFGGYEQYKVMLMAQKYFTKIPKVVRSSIIPALYSLIPLKVINRFFKYASSLGDAGRDRFFSFLKDYKGNYDDYAKIITIFEKREVSQICNSDIPRCNDLIKPYYSHGDLLSKMLRVDYNMFLRHLLLKTDKMSMAHGLEVRVPFLDKDLRHLASTIPSNAKIKGMNEKYILKKSMARVLPREVVTRKKQRFFVPIDYWFRNILKDKVEEIFTPRNIKNRGYFKPEYFNHLFRKYNSSPLYYGRQLWSVLNFEMWARVYLDQEDVRRPELRLSKLV